jgi:uncharacterized membrane protein
MSGPGFGPGVVIGPNEITALLLIAVAVLAVWQIRLSRDKRVGKEMSMRDQDEKKAEEIARERYARGEISRDEFLQISEDLRRR